MSITLKSSLIKRWPSLAHPKVVTLKRPRLVTKFNSLFLIRFLPVRSKYLIKLRTCFCLNCFTKSKETKLHAWPTSCPHSNLSTRKTPWSQVIHLKRQSCLKEKTFALCSLSIDQDLWVAAESKSPKKPSNFSSNRCLSVPNSPFWDSVQDTNTKKLLTERIFGSTTIKLWNRSCRRLISSQQTTVEPTFLHLCNLLSSLTVAKDRKGYLFWLMVKLETATKLLNTPSSITKSQEFTLSVSVKVVTKP